MNAIRRFLNRLGVWLVLHTQDRDFSDPVKDAVFRAFCDCGLNKDSFNEDFDLLRAGKLVQVYHLAARNLGTDPELNTVGDVIKWLKD